MRGLVVILVLAAAGYGVTQFLDRQREETNLSSESFTYGDWKITCVERKDALPCDMSQRIVDGPTGLSLLNISLAYSPAVDKHAIQITLPLGVWLEPGLGMQVGEVTVNNIQYSRCLPQGCLVEAMLEDPMFSAMKEGQSGQLAVFDRTKQAVTLPFSLKGFSNGLQRLERETQNKLGGGTDFSVVLNKASDFFAGLTAGADEPEDSTDSPSAQGD